MDVLAEQAAKRVRKDEEEKEEERVQPAQQVERPGLAVYVRYQVEDGLGNQMWRAFAAENFRWRIHNRIEELALGRYKLCTRVLAVEPYAFRPGANARVNASPHEPNEPPYTPLLLPDALSVSSTDPFAVAPNNLCWADRPQDEDIGDTADAFVENVAQLAVCNADTDDLVMADVRGCCQRVELLPKLSVVRRLLAQQMERDWPETAALAVSPIATNELWTVHLRFGDYKRMMDAQHSTDYDAMKTWVKEQFAAVRASCRARAMQPVFNIVTHAAWRAEAEKLVLAATSKNDTVIWADTMNALQTLRYLADAKGCYICSPSSLGWWGAALSHAQRILLPRPWLRAFGAQRAMEPSGVFGQFDPQPWRWEPAAHTLQNFDQEEDAAAELDDDPAALHEIYLRTYMDDLAWAKLCLVSIAAHWRPTPRVHERLIVHGGREVLDALRTLWWATESEAAELCPKREISPALGECEANWGCTGLKVEFIETAPGHDTYDGQQADKLERAVLIANTEQDRPYPYIFITYIDSDVQARRPFSFSTFVPDGKRPTLLRTPWEEVPEAERWRAATENALGLATTHEHMRRLPITHHVGTVASAVAHAARRRGLASGEWLASVSHHLYQDFSEFNYVGAYATHYESGAYDIGDPKQQQQGEWPFVQQWSGSFRAGPADTRADAEREFFARGLSALLPTVCLSPPVLRLPSGVCVPSGDSHFLPWFATLGFDHQTRHCSAISAAITSWFRARAQDLATNTRFVAIDGGAYVGAISTEMYASLTEALAWLASPGARAHVLSIEPAQPQLTALTKNAAMIKAANRSAAVSWQIIAAALGRKREEPKWVAASSSDISAGTLENFGATQIRNERGALNDQTVEVTSIDALALEVAESLTGAPGCERDVSAAAVCFVKLDLEGYEFFALEGAGEVLQKCRPALLLELAPGHLQRATGEDKTAASVIARLMRYGYEPYTACHNGRLVRRGTMDALLATYCTENPPAQDDVLFMHPDTVSNPERKRLGAISVDSSDSSDSE